MSKKVLIVDDDPSILLSLEFLMTKQGFEVFIARNGREAMEIVLREQPQVAVLDIMMPDVDGYAVCRYVREKSADTRVIFLSAKSRPEDVEKGYEAGADRYLTKPFSTRTLMREVHALATSTPL